MMKKIILLGLCLISISMHAQEGEVKATIQTFFEGFHTKDTIKMKHYCHEKMLLQSINESTKGTKLIEEKATDFFKSMTKIPENIKFEERILNFEVKIDGSMAHVWTPYEFYINGTYSHGGVNAFTLILENNQWKIVHMIDTRRKKK